MYEITEDVKAVWELFNNAVDAEGNPRELNEEEKAFLKECFSVTQEEFEQKFDSYGKFMANLKLDADNAEAERKNFKAEMDRLSARAKAFNNRRDCVKNYLYYAMDNIGMKSFKTALFSANVQNTAASIKVSDQNLMELGTPEKYLKPRELNVTAIKEDIKSGTLIVTDSGRIFYEDGLEMIGVISEKGKTLVIR